MTKPPPKLTKKEKEHIGYIVLFIVVVSFVGACLLLGSTCQFT